MPDYTPHEFILRIRAPARDDEFAMNRRLRAALKSLGRRFDFTVVECRPAEKPKADGE